MRLSVTQSLKKPEVDLTQFLKVTHEIFKFPRDRLAVPHRHVIASIVEAISICQIFQKNIRLSVIYKLFENLDRPPVKLLECTINEEHNKTTVFDKTWLHSNLNSRNHQKILYAILLLRFCAHFMYLLGS